MTVRNALLGLLAQRPRHGYELHAAFEALAGGKQNWEVKPAQIYATLNRLEESNLIAPASVEQNGGPEKLTYTITPAGEAELVNWLRAPVEAQHQRDEFFLKLVLSLATGAVDPYQLIYAQRTSFYRQLHNITARRVNADPAAELAYILLLERAAMHLEADLRWLDMIEARLDEIKRQPIPEPTARPRGRPPKNT